ncbi:MAG: DUF4442 domain-containing protein [Rhodobacter sp.]|nr:DUF4442 domain-containing protein [Paracoccaceae bacterium]MCC0078324.1 DUF4442 domain-containing protein [Rhodobacter sp.]
MTPFEMIKAHLSTAVPFATYTGVVIETVGDGTARASLPMRREVSNHIGTPHAGAMFTLGEAVSGAAMAGAFADTLLGLRPVAAEARIGYLKVAKGDLTAEARTDQAPDSLRATLAAEGKVSFPVLVAITDETGAEVARMEIAWHVSPVRG